MSDELVEVFVAEGRELVDQASAALAALRGGVADAQAFDSLFRAFHTLKGSAGLMDFAGMAEVSHLAEDRLTEAQENAGGRLDDVMAEALFAVLDQTEAWLDETAATEAVPRNVEAAAAALVQVLSGVEATAPEARADAEARAGPAASTATRTLRVEAERIDQLAAAADELAVLKNRLGKLAVQAMPALEPELARELAKAQAELERQALQLHSAVTRLRVTPLNRVFRRFSRLVRETAASLGKQVQLDLSGGDLEVDKAIADGLSEALLHLVRNAIDHAIETPEARRAAGKPVPARLAINAFPLGEQAVIEVADDGRGIDLAAVRRTALARGLADETTLAAMSDADAAELVFTPGFSTASAVGDLSGRGVGLDAVRAAVTALGGRVAMTSEPGRGTRFSIAVPLNVRLAQIMTVQAGDQTYGVPLESVIETAHIAPAELTPVRAGRAFVWRDQVAPLLDLAELLRLPAPPARDRINVLVVQTGEEVVGVAVDAIGERMESPLRPMTGLLAGVAGVAGATLTGDGKVLMVLDLPELIG